MEKHFKEAQKLDHAISELKQCKWCMKHLKFEKTVQSLKVIYLNLNQANTRDSGGIKQIVNKMYDSGKHTPFGIATKLNMKLDRVNKILGIRC